MMKKITKPGQLCIWPAALQGWDLEMLVCTFRKYYTVPVICNLPYCNSNHYAHDRELATGIKI